jgi:hypothetical protein
VGRARYRTATGTVTVVSPARRVREILSGEETHGAQ